MLLYRFEFRIDISTVSERLIVKYGLSADGKQMSRNEIVNRGPFINYKLRLVYNLCSRRYRTWEPRSVLTDLLL